jgi:hypothetical protein
MFIGSSHLLSIPFESGTQLIDAISLSLLPHGSRLTGYFVIWASDPAVTGNTCQIRLPVTENRVKSLRMQVSTLILTTSCRTPKYIFAYAGIAVPKKLL